MKKVLLVAMVVSSLFAKTNVSLNIGNTNFDTKELLDSGTTLGIRGDFYLDNLYHIDLGLDSVKDVKFEDGSGSTDIKRIYTQFSADGEEEYHVVPYMGVGLGYEKVGDESDELKDQPYISANIGFRYNISNSFNFLLDGKALWKTSTRNINYVTSFGIGYMIDEQPINTQLQAQEIIIPTQKLEIQEPVTVSSTFRTPEPIVKDYKQLSVAPQPLHIKPLAPVIQQPQTHQQPVIVAKPVSNMTPETVGGTYIQVAAYKQYQPRALLSKLTRLGNKVIIRRTSSGKKALIGPYRTRGEAQKALLNIKKVTRSAFIYKG